jgi:lysosomal alpha-mannosidase
LYDEGETVEVEWTVGPIPVSDNIGKEIILRYDTDIQSQSKFYTDANGREVLERTRDYRPTWNYTVAEPVSGNYYPVNSRIWIKEQARQFTVLTGKNSFVQKSCRTIFKKNLTQLLLFHSYRSIRRWC